VPNNQGNTVRYAGEMVFDKSGNLTVVTNSSGTVQERYSYDAYGNVTIYDADWDVRTSSTENNALLFAGMFVDPTTGLYYARARWYNPSTGGFISQDPAQAETNLYGYAGDNPIDQSDPTGLYVGYPSSTDGPTEFCVNPLEDGAQKEVKDLADKEKEQTKKGIQSLKEITDKQAAEDQQWLKGQLEAQSNKAVRAGLTKKYPLTLPADSEGQIIKARVVNGQLRRIVGKDQIASFRKIDLVVRDDGSWFVGRGHCVLNGQGNTVRFAGELNFDANHDLILVSNRSGHYAHSSEVGKAILQYLKNLGVNTSKAKFVPIPGS
jgi:RHS repeat-associated protein